MTAPDRPVAAANAAALAFGAAGLLMLGLQPILLDQLVVAGKLSLELAGPLAMAEIFAIGLGAALPNLLLPLTGLRRLALTATLLLALANLLTPLAAGIGALFAARTVAGLAGGVLVWLASLLIVRHRAPERLAAAYLLLQSLTQAGAAATLALAAIPVAGLSGGFAGLALLSLLPLAALRGLPDRLTPLPHSEGHPLPPVTPAVLLAGLTVLGGMACISGVWAFLDAIGRVHGLPAQSVQMVIAATLVAQIGGALAAGWLAGRVPPAPWLGLATAALLGLALAFGHTVPLALPAFTGLSLAFGFVWLFAMPFQVKLALQAEPDGRLAMLTPALQLLGSALGPLVAGLLMRHDRDLATLSLSAAAFAALALLALAAAGFTSRRTVPAASPLPDR
jgi:predicted MFS family arabinose efflux permease